MWTDPGNIEIAHRHMNVETGAEAALFPGKEYIIGIAVAVCSILPPRPILIKGILPHICTRVSHTLSIAQLPVFLVL
jgi:hypothetical protein